MGRADFAKKAIASNLQQDFTSGSLKRLSSPAEEHILPQALKAALQKASEGR
jgi:hypothetical protein